MTDWVRYLNVYLSLERLDLYTHFQNMKPETVPIKKLSKEKLNKALNTDYTYLSNAYQERPLERKYDSIGKEIPRNYGHFRRQALFSWLFRGASTSGATWALFQDFSLLHLCLIFAWA